MMTRTSNKHLKQVGGHTCSSNTKVGRPYWSCIATRRTMPRKLGALVMRVQRRGALARSAPRNIDQTGRCSTSLELEQSTKGACTASWNAAVFVDEAMWLGNAGMINSWRRRTLNLAPIRVGMGGSSLLHDARVPFSYMWSNALLPRPHDWPPHVPQFPCFEFFFCNGVMNCRF